MWKSPPAVLVVLLVAVFAQASAAFDLSLRRDREIYSLDGRWAAKLAREVLSDFYRKQIAAGTSH